MPASASARTQQALKLFLLLYFFVLLLAGIPSCMNNYGELSPSSGFLFFFFFGPHLLSITDRLDNAAHLIHNYINFVSLAHFCRPFLSTRSLSAFTTCIAIIMPLFPLNRYECIFVFFFILKKLKILTHLSLVACCRHCCGYCGSL